MTYNPKVGGLNKTEKYKFQNVFITAIFEVRRNKVNIYSPLSLMSKF